MKGFEILAGFLERCAEDVSGHILEEPGSDLREDLRAFAKGELSQSERQRVIEALRQNPGWIPLLASEAKSLRDSSRG